MARIPKPKMNIINQIMGQGAGAGIGLTYDLDPSAVILVAEFNKLGMDIRSFKEPLHRAIKIMGPSFQQNFDVGGRPRWEPLSRYTVDRKVLEGRRRPSAPLIRSGLLRKEVGFQKIWKIDGIEGYAAVDNLGGADYGIYHQRGREGEEIGILTGARDKAGVPIIKMSTMGGLPQREFLVFQKSDEKAIDDIFIKWFQERTIAVGFRPGATGVLGGA